MRFLNTAALGLVLLSACGENNPPMKLPANAAQLLTGDSAKTWMLARRDNDDMRVNMGPCYMGFRQTYFIEGTFTDNNGDQEADCGESMHGRWYLRYNKDSLPFITLQSKLIPKAFGIEEEYKSFQILSLSDTLLVLRFKHHLFSNNATTVVDTFVPEDTHMPDRYFHW